MSEALTYKSGYAALIGRPNVGKSTLLNRLVSFKISATSKTPQTTRNKITGICHFLGGQIILLDTPGIHRAKSKLNQAMVKTSLSVFNDVDLILFIIDSQKGMEEEDEYVLKQLSQIDNPKILVLNKIDLVSKPLLLPLIKKLQNYEIFQDVVPISALEQDGLDVLSQIILKHLPAGPPYFPKDTITDCPEQFLIAEIIREKTIRLTRFEVPYAVAVVVEAVKQGQKKDVTVIYATLFVEKVSQRKILVGKNGAMLREIGSRARQEIEKLFGGQVYLNLHVKIKSKWRESDYYLKEFGYR